jgi:hypothetical protein
MNLTRRLLAVLVAATMLLGTAVACDSTGDDTYRPSSYGPTIAGQASCAWIVDPSECSDSGVPSGNWYQMPGSQPSGYNADNLSTMIFALWWWRLAYDPWYASSAYYGYYVPSRYRSTYVSQHVTYVENHYRTQINNYSKHTTYRSSSGKTVSGSKVPAKRFGTKSTRTGSGSCNALNLWGGGTLLKVAPGSSRGGSISGGSRSGSSRSGPGSTRSRSGSSKSGKSGSAPKSKSTSKKGC